MGSFTWRKGDQHAQKFVTDGHLPGLRTCPDPCFVVPANETSRLYVDGVEYLWTPHPENDNYVLAEITL